MTVEEMRLARNLLTKRMEEHTANKEARIKKLLADPTDRNIENQICLIHEEEKRIDEIWEVMRDLKFAIEDITGEPEA